MAADQGPERLAEHIGGQDEEGGANQPQGAPLPAGVQAALELPDHHHRGEDLDQAVQPEARERRRSGLGRGRDHHRRADEVPGQGGVFEPQATAQEDSPVRHFAGDARTKSAMVSTTPGPSGRSGFT